MLRTISLSCALAVMGLLFAQTLTSCSSSSSTGGGATGGADCKSVCAKGDALKCPQDTPGDCAAQCDSSPAACKSQLDALTSCGASATYTCGADGTATAGGCDQQVSAYIGCVFTNSGFDGGFTEGD